LCLQGTLVAVLVQEFLHPGAFFLQLPAQFSLINRAEQVAGSEHITHLYVKPRQTASGRGLHLNHLARMDEDAPPYNGGWETAEYPPEQGCTDQNTQSR
jgi:hypothetical protein